MAMMDMIAWREGGQKAKKKEKKIHFFQPACADGEMHSWVSGAEA